MKMKPTPTATLSTFWGRLFHHVTVVGLGGMFTAYIDDYRLLVVRRQQDLNHSSHPDNQ